MLGKIFRISFAGHVLQDHPRMRGVHKGISACMVSVSGSSPHARGPLTRSFSLSTSSRIIPACAGSTSLHTLYHACTRDHPRMRGVHFFVLHGGKRPFGSSPHARGPHYNNGILNGEWRIIPACAGSTLLFRNIYSVEQDHPLMRGVH